MKDTLTNWILLTMVGLVLFLDKANGIDLHEALITRILGG